MAPKRIALALAIIVGASPVSAASDDSTPRTPAPPGTPATQYCMYIEAITGSRLEEIKCWTREEWADRGVDVDQDWPKEGVRTVG